MTRKMTEEQIKEAIDQLMNEIRTLNVESQADLLKDIVRAKASEFFNDSHFIDWVRRQIEWHKAFEQ